MKNLIKLDGFKNRHIDGLPKEKVNIIIFKYNKETLCEWRLFDKTKYSENNISFEGFLGTAVIIYDEGFGGGFHAWTQNNSGFVYYKIDKLSNRLKKIKKFLFL